MKYLAQAILIDGEVETVVNSIKTDDYNATIRFLMQRHKSSSQYLYIAMDIETQEILVHTEQNLFSW